MADKLDSTETWTPAHDMALLFMALAYGADARLTDDEISALSLALAGWRPEDDEEEVRDIVMEATAVFMQPDATDSVMAAMKRLGERLSETSRMRAIEDIIRIAEADGILLSSERTFISSIAREWSVRETEQRLIDASDATVDDRPVWSLLHDIALLAVTIALGSHGGLSAVEIDSIVKRLNAWQSDLDEDDARSILRSVLEVCASGADEKLLIQSASSIRDGLELTQRLVVLDDLVAVAESDGPLIEVETEMISMLAQAWNLDIRFTA